MVDGMTKEDIQEAVRVFGTDNDRDPDSNPKQNGSRCNVLMEMSGRNNESVHVMKNE